MSDQPNSPQRSVRRMPGSWRVDSIERGVARDLEAIFARGGTPVVSRGFESGIISFADVGEPVAHGRAGKRWLWLGLSLVLAICGASLMLYLFRAGHTVGYAHGSVPPVPANRMAARLSAGDRLDPIPPKVATPAAVPMLAAGRDIPPCTKSPGAPCEGHAGGTITKVDAAGQLTAGQAAADRPLTTATDGHDAIKPVGDPRCAKSGYRGAINCPPKIVLDADRELAGAYVDAINANLPEADLARYSQRWAQLRQQAADNPDDTAAAYESMTAELKARIVASARKSS